MTRLKNFFFTTLMLASCAASAQQKAFSNEPGSWVEDSSSWKTFRIEMIRDSTSRVTGGHANKISQFVDVKSESQWLGMRKADPKMGSAKLLGYSQPNNVPVFCTVSCDGFEPGRTVMGLESIDCSDECNTNPKQNIDKFFAANQMNLHPSDKRVGPKLDKATGIMVGDDGMYHDLVTGAARTPAEEAVRRAKKTRVIGI